MAIPVKAYILTINGGSSRIKFAFFETGDSLRQVVEDRSEHETSKI
ncbi:MAG: hypothetical protein WB402_04255 [Sulfuricaulis sp.]